MCLFSFLFFRLKLSRIKSRLTFVFHLLILSYYYINIAQRSVSFAPHLANLLTCSLVFARVSSGGVRRSDGSHRVQQQRPEDQLHPEDPGETPCRP